MNTWALPFVNAVKLVTITSLGQYQISYVIGRILLNCETSVYSSCSWFILGIVSQKISFLRQIHSGKWIEWTHSFWHWTIDKVIWLVSILLYCSLMNNTTCFVSFMYGLLHAGESVTWVHHHPFHPFVIWKTWQFCKLRSYFKTFEKAKFFHQSINFIFGCL